MLLELGIPSFDTIIHSYTVRFSLSLGTCDKLLVKCFTRTTNLIHSLIFAAYCALHFCHVSACFMFHICLQALFSLSVFYVSSYSRVCFAVLCVF